VSRVTDESGLEILVFSSWELERNKEYIIEGRLIRKDGKLALSEAVVSDGETSSIAEIKEKYDLDPREEKVKLAGRLVTLRQMGKALFGHIQDIGGKIQIYLRKDIVPHQYGRVNG